MRTWIIKHIIRPQWTSFQVGERDEWELGVKIWGITFALYKARVYYPEKIRTQREPHKREYGESLHPQQ